MRSFQKTLFTLLAPLFLSTGLAACSSGPTGDQRNLGSLNQTELTQLCEQEQMSITPDEITAVARFICVLGEGFNPNGCTQDGIDKCVAAEVAASNAAVASPDNCKGSSLDTAHCDITVAEFDACQHDALDQIVNESKDLTCSSLSTTPPANPQTAASPPSCDVVKAKCPSALQDNSMPAPIKQVHGPRQ